MKQSLLQHGHDKAHLILKFEFHLLSFAFDLLHSEITADIGVILTSFYELKQILVSST